MAFRKILPLMLCCFVLAATAQNLKQRNIDSLIQTLPKMKEDKEKILRLNTIAYRYQSIDAQAGMKYAKQALALAEKLNDNNGKAEALRMIGWNYSVDSNEKALAYYQKALTFTKDKDILANLYMGMGLIYTYQSDYKNAMKYDLMALKLAEEIKDEKQIISMSSNIGIIYYDLGNFPKALEYYNKALAGNIKLGRKTGIAYSYGNIGNVYSSMGENDKAIGYYEKAAAISIELGDLMSKSMSYSAMGDIYFQQKKYDKAMQYVNESLEISRKMQDSRNIAYGSAVLGDIQLEMAKLPQYAAKKKELLQNAIANFNESSALQKEQQSLKDIFTNYEQMALAYQLLGNYQKAFELSQLSIKYKDSIYNQDTKETIKNLEDKRAIELRDKQIQLNKAKLQSKEREKWLYISGIGFLLVIAGLVFMQSRNRKKNNEKLLQLNTELDQANKVKARFFSILNHDLRSPVSSLINFLHLQKESPDLLDADAKKRMETQTITSAENLLDSMEDLLLWSKGQMENFKPQPTNIAVRSIFDDLQKHFSSVENVKIIFENPENIKVFTDENYLKTILRNLTGNAIKALEKTPNGTIVLNAFQSEGKVRIAVSDNGPGGTMEKFRALYDENQVVGIKTGLGLHLIRDLAKAIHCDIVVDTKVDSGTTFTLSF
ncbi:tetratricopeptide repeat protein [Flavobacterium sp.]|uniref:ATP-binding protein n=1 Tax=Flavobacterium sp. TaxID=239 RepID=UPI0039E6EBEF